MTYFVDDDHVDWRTTFVSLGHETIEDRVAAIIQRADHDIGLEEHGVFGLAVVVGAARFDVAFALLFEHNFI